MLKIKESTHSLNRIMCTLLAVLMAFSIYSMPSLVSAAGDAVQQPFAAAYFSAAGLSIVNNQNNINNAKVEVLNAGDKDYGVVADISSAPSVINLIDLTKALNADGTTSSDLSRNFISYTFTVPAQVSCLVSVGDKLYIGTLDGRLFVFDGQSMELGYVGSPYNDGTGILDIVMAPDGVLYGSTNLNAKAFAYDSKTKQFNDLGSAGQSMQYAYQLDYDAADNALYVVAGNDAGTKKSADLIAKYDVNGWSAVGTEPLYASAQGPTDMTSVGGKLLFLFPDGYTLRMVDKATGAVTSDFTQLIGGTYKSYGHGKSFIRDEDGSVYFIAYIQESKTRNYVYKFDSAGAFTKISIAGYGTGQSTFFTYLFPHFYTTAGGNKMLLSWYTASYPTQVIGVLKCFDMNASTTETRDIPVMTAGITGTAADVVAKNFRIPLEDVYTSGNGKPYVIGNGYYLNAGGATVTGISSGGIYNKITAAANGEDGMMYFGTLGGSALSKFSASPIALSIFAVDPTAASFAPAFKAMMNTTPTSGEITSMAAANGKIYAGMLGLPGSLTGSVGIFDLSAGTSNAYTILDNQGVASVAYKNGKVYCGTTVYGPTNETPSASDAAIVVLNEINQERKVVAIDGAKAVSSMVVGPDQNIWAYADGSVIVFDPVSDSIIAKIEIGAIDANVAKSSLAVKEGAVYGIGKRIFFKVDPDSMKATILDTLGGYTGMAAGDGCIYLTGGIASMGVYQYGGTVDSTLSLKSATPSAGILAPEFTPDNVNYRIVLPYETVQTPSISVEANDATSVLALKQPQSLTGSAYDRSGIATVTAASNDKYASYSFLADITYPDLSLKSLKYNTTEVAQKYSEFVTSYTVYLPYGTTDIPVLTAEANNPDAVVSVAQAQNLSGTAEERSAAVTVTDSVTKLVKNYAVQFIVRPKSKDAMLKSLSVDNGDLIPAFSPHQTSYIVLVPQEVTTPPQVKAVVNDDTATCNISQATKISGASEESTAIVTVTAQDGVTQNTYTLNFIYEMGIYEDLGPGVTKLTTISSEAVPSEDGKFNYILLGLAANPSCVAVLRSDTGACVNTFPIPNAVSIWTMLAGNDGNVYIGDYGNGKLWRYRPGASSLEDLGVAIEGESIICYLVNGPDGKIYGGTYPHGKVFEYDINTATFKDLVGRVDPSEEYIRKLAYDKDDNDLYLGTGASCKLYKLDLDTMTLSQNLIPESYAFEAFPVGITVMDNEVAIMLGADYNLLVYDKTSIGADGKFDKILFDQKFRSVESFIPDPDNHAFYFYYMQYDSAGNATNGLIAKYDFKTNTTSVLQDGVGRYGYWKSVQHMVALNDSGLSGKGIIAIRSHKGIYKVSLNPDGTYSNSAAVDGDPPPQPIYLTTLGKGSDGRIYATGMQGGMGIFDPVTGTHFVSTAMSQGESVYGFNGKTYFGIYPHARVSEYDPNVVFGTNGQPQEILAYPLDKLQDRPQNIVGLESTGKLYIGSIPSYGQNQGCFAIFDPVTKEAQYYMDVVLEESILSLTSRGALIFGGTGIVGSIGSDVTQTEGKVFVWDAIKNEKLAEFAPVSGAKTVTGLFVGPDDLIWGYAEGCLFKVNPETFEVVYRNKILSPTSDVSWRDAEFRYGDDGYIYGFASSTVFKIAPSTMKVYILNNSLGLDECEVDQFGNFYFKTASHVWKLTPDSMPDESLELSSISVNGEPLPNFNSQDMRYDAVTYINNPQITAVPKEPNSIVTVKPLYNVNGSESDRTATITVQSADMKRAATYTVTMTRQEQPLKEVSIAVDKTNLQRNETANLSVTGTAIDGVAADLTGAVIEYTSSNPEAVSVENGIAAACNTGSADISATVTLNGQTLQTAPITISVTTSIESIRRLIAAYEKSGEISGPLIPQLENSLEQAEHQLSINRKDHAITHMEDFIKHLNNPALQENVSEAAENALNSDAKALIEVWNAE